jgi:hypothetical protein
VLVAYHHEPEAKTDTSLGTSKRGKQAAFPEFGSIAHSKRAEWLANVHRYVVANRASIQALFYFHRPSTVAAYDDCRWPLTTYAEFTAYGDMARDS